MDFRAVLRLVVERFDKENVRYGLIGGFALGALGVPRATIDLDFLINRDDLPKVDTIMTDLGYRCVYKSEDVSQYVSGLNIFGEVDFIHAFRSISSKMLERAEEKEVFSGSLKVKTLRPEDIIGLKLQALVNDSTRAVKEYFDIESLMAYYKTGINW